MSSKINWLINNSTSGGIILQTWLSHHGIGHSLTQRYVSSGWLKKLSSGVFYRPLSQSDAYPDWTSALHAMKNQSDSGMYLSGLTSLKHQGLSHYLQLSESKIWVGITSKKRLPKWFVDFPDQEWVLSKNSKLTHFQDKDFTTLTIKGLEITASSAELSAYEVVDSIGKQLTFEYVSELFQGLTNLSPRKVQSILERSNSVQTNRVFLYLSHYYNHQWVKRLDESKVKLGAGKRQVVEHGKLDERYQIIVPKNLVGTNNG